MIHRQISAFKARLLDLLHQKRAVFTASCPVIKTRLWRRLFFHLITEKTESCLADQGRAQGRAFSSRQQPPEAGCEQPLPPRVTSRSRGAARRAHVRISYNISKYFHPIFKAFPINTFVPSLKYSELSPRAAGTALQGCFTLPHAPSPQATRSSLQELRIRASPVLAVPRP